MARKTILIILLITVLPLFVNCSDGKTKQLNIVIDFDDTDNNYTRHYTDITRCLKGAFKIIEERLDISTSVELRVNVKFPEANNLSCASVEFSRTGSNGTVNIYEQGAAAVLKNPEAFADSAYHIVLNVGTNRLNTLWFDPAPEERTAEIPEGSYSDAVSIMLHELIHAFALNGWLDSSTGNSTSPNGTLSTYDVNVINDNGTLYFAGENAVAQYGGPIPLSFNNYKHYGNEEPGPGSDLAGYVMFGFFYSWRYRFYLSELDVAILKDSGMPVK
ncbi:hypothetical protein ACFL20_02515 [Spirochaetota bacterium]